MRFTPAGPVVGFALVWCSQFAVADTTWPGYNNSFDAQRFSPLGQINRKNIADLQETCELALGDDGAFESGPLVIGDTLYVTTSNTTVALGATDCKVRWRVVHEPEEEEYLHVNRGVAYLDGRIFRGTTDGRLRALSAKSGKELWRVKAADPKLGEYLSAAPVAWRNLLFIGPAGSDRGIHGRMTAYDTATGKELWRFNTIPMGDEPGAETWQGAESTKRGGGTWSSYTLDATAGELFIAVGNPAPDLNPELRPGANLYTDSLVVLDAKTGKLKWYYQLRPNDGFDLDAGAAPVLYVDQTGQPRVALGSKDGHVYGIDRRTHQLVFKTPVTTILNADKQPTAAGLRACPGALGGVQWNGPAYSPITKYLYVGAVDWCAIFRSEPPTLDPPKTYYGTDLKPTAEEPRSGWITALNADTGDIVWRYHAAQPVVAAITPTAGNVVLGGDLGGNLLALDSNSGEVLRTINLAGALAGGIITYSVRGRQYIAAAAGNLSRASFFTVGTPRLIILTNGLAPNYRAHRLAVDTKEEIGSGSEEDQGKLTFSRICSACHGAAAEGGGSGPVLIDESRRKTLEQVIAFVKNPAAPMPKLYPTLLSDDDVRKVAKYIESLH